MSKRYSNYHETDIDRPDVDDFISDLIEVYKKHGFALSIDPKQPPFGGFIVAELTEENVEWLERAAIGSSLYLDEMYER